MATRSSYKKITLDISKLNEIIQVLRHHNFSESKWYNLGLALRLLQPTLASIEASCGANVSRCLKECLSKWLSKADSSVGPLTWETLGRALREIDEIAVAENIIDIMAAPASQLLQHYSDRLSHVVLNKRTVQLLHTEGIMTMERATEVERYGCVLEGDSLIAVYTAVTKDSNKLKLLADILMNTPDAVSLANDITKQAFPLLPAPSMPVITPEGNTTMEVPLYSHHCVEFDRMRSELGNLIHSLAPFIESSISSLDDLKIWLRRIRPEMEQHLQVAESFDNVMKIIEGKCTIVNITVLEDIINHYSIEAARSLLSNYNEKVEKFCGLENSLRICNNANLRGLCGASHLTCEIIKFVLNWKIDQRTLNDIRGLLTKAFSSLANRVEVVVITEGNSITVTCYAPYYLMESLLVIAKGNLDLLKKEGLISLTIGYYTVYDQMVINEEVNDRLKLVEQQKQDSSQEDQEKIKRGMYFELEKAKKELEEKNKEIKELKTLGNPSSSIDELSFVESFHLFEFAMKNEDIAIPVIKDIRKIPSSDSEKASLLSKHIKEDPSLLTELKALMNSEFNNPWGVAVSHDGSQIIVSEWGSNCVTILDNEGKRVKSFGVKEGHVQFINPHGVVITPDNAILVTDNHNLYKLTVNETESIASVGKYSRSSHQFDTPYGMAISRVNGDVYVADMWNHRIEVFTTDDLSFSHSFGTKGSANGEFQRPRDIAINSKGLLYVTDLDNHRIQVFTSEGQFVNAFGSKGSDPGQLIYPEGITIDMSTDLVYVTEEGNNRVSVFNSEGQFVKFAVNGMKLNKPQGIQYVNGKLYICDKSKNRLVIV